MRAHEILLELSVGEVRYGSWNIKFTKKPMQHGVYRANGFLIKKNQVLSSVKAEGKSQEEAIQNVKKEIDQQTDITKAGIQQNIKVSDVVRSTIDFNVDVTKVIFNNNEPTAARFVEDGGIVYLDIVTHEAMERNWPQFKQDGFVKMHTRQLAKSDTSTEGYAIGITPFRVDKLGLEFNGRYTLDETKSPDPDFRRFKLQFDSIVQSREDKMALGIPAITIATWTRGNQDARM